MACKECGKEFIANHPRQVFCDTRCRSVYHARAYCAKWKSEHPRPEYFEYECGNCNVAFKLTYRISGAAASQGFYCLKCRPEIRRSRYRQKSVTRRGYLSSARVSVEQLVQRDGYDCAICGESIDIALPRTSKQGATIDHRIPLSKGGSDELDNLQLAHWICNNRKADKITNA